MRRPAITAKYRARVPESLRLDAKKEIERLLQQSIELPAMSFLCCGHGFSRYLVRYHYPKLYERYMSRRTREQNARRANNRKKRAQRILHVAEEMIKDNIYPSQRKLWRSAGVRKSDLRRPEVRRALEELINGSSIRCPRSPPYVKRS